MYVYKSMVGSRVTNAHHIINSALTGLRSPAGPRCLGTATRISASLSRRLSVFFGSVSDQDPKAAKFAVLIPGPGMFVNVRNAPRVVIAPHLKQPLFRPVIRCVRSFAESRVCTRFRSEGKRGPFVREVEKRDEKRFETELVPVTFWRYSRERFWVKSRTF